jgi:hypothetical protein
MASGNILREVFSRFADAHGQLAHNSAGAFTQHGTTQPGLKRRMAAHGFNTFPCTPLDYGTSPMCPM